MFEHVHLHGRRMRKEHVAHIATDLAALTLKGVVDQVALQLGRGVEDRVTDFALVDVSFLHHVGGHVHLDLVLGGERLLALDTLECLLGAAAAAATTRARRHRRREWIFTLDYTRWTPTVRVM